MTELFERFSRRRPLASFHRIEPYWRLVWYSDALRAP